MSKPVNILVVEDSEDDARLVMRVLSRGGFQPTCRRVQGLEELLASFEQERWDAVLSDFRMPQFSGLEALRAFRSLELDIPFIFVSGTIGEEVAVEAMKAGASDYVMKQNLARLPPVLKRELAQAVIRADHRKAQRELELSRDRYVDLYELAPVGYLTLSAEGRIEQLNLNGADMLGIRRDALQGMRFTDFINPAEHARWNAHFERVLQDGARQRLELALQRSGMETLHVQLDCMRDAAPGSTAPSVRLAITDIHERKEAESELIRYEAQLRHSQKMESIGTLAGGIAHDFNNIVGAILGNSALALGSIDAGHPASALLHEVHKASLRARMLVRQILTFSRREPQELHTQSLAPVVEETHQLLRATLPAGIELEMHIADDVPRVEADATQVQQVLMNLCTNAWHALRGGAGLIRIGLDAVVLDATACQRLGTLRAGRHAHLWVSDDGTGMDDATRERIFEPFFTTKQVGQGTGLGLSVAHGIAVAHHGAISVESAPGAGTTLHLYLPAADPASPDDVAPDAALAVASGRGQRVIYVDDDEAMVVMVERLLENGGYRVQTFNDARLAIAHVREHPRDVDLLVTDYNMPACSGIELARELSCIRPDLPVLLSSGYITDELRAEARAAGVRELLEKENSFEELCPLVARILAAPVTAGGPGAA